VTGERTRWAGTTAFCELELGVLSKVGGVGIVLESMCVSEGELGGGHFRPEFGSFLAGIGRS
jgi:hypothetical protein